MTEVLEFAVSLLPQRKGETFAGFPGLVPRKLMHACLLEEYGDINAAKRYGDAVAITLKHAPLHAALYSGMHVTVMSRISGHELEAQQGSWMRRSLQRPTLDGVWGALEGRLAKFIAGEDEVPEKPSQPEQKEVGAFTHYSVITPDVASLANSEVMEEREHDGDFVPDDYAEGYQPEDFAQGTENHSGDSYQGDLTVGNPQSYGDGAYAPEHYAGEVEYAPEVQPQESEYAPDDYRQEGEYAEGEYAEGEYAEGEYVEGEYAQGEYTPGDYAPEDYAEGEFAAEGEYEPEGEYAPEYGQDGYAADGGYAAEDLSLIHI